MSLTFLDLVNKIDVVSYPEETESYAHFSKNVYTFVSHDGSFNLGYLLPLIVAQLRLTKDLVVINDTTKTVQIDYSLSTLESRNEAFANLGQSWKSAGLFETLRGWRNELYTIYSGAETPYMRLERAVCPLMGVVMYGVHINGYVVDDSPDTQPSVKIWVPRRSATKPTYPGMLDNTVAGGLGYPYGRYETCIKECYEEAGLDAEYVKKNLVSVGVISYLYQMERDGFEKETGLVQPEVEYVYDLRMDEDIVPHPVDHEAEDFQLMDLEEVVERLKAGEFKHNCAGIIIDFLMRHGHVTEESEPDFDEINRKLHRVLPFPIQ